MTAVPSPEQKSLGDESLRKLFCRRFAYNHDFRV